MVDDNPYRMDDTINVGRDNNLSLEQNLDDKLFEDHIKAKYGENLLAMFEDIIDTDYNESNHYEKIDRCRLCTSVLFGDKSESDHDDSYILEQPRFSHSFRYSQNE